MDGDRQSDGDDDGEGVPPAAPSPFQVLVDQRADRLPCALVSADGVVRRLEGAARSWFPEATGQPLSTLFAEGVQVERCIAHGMLGCEELCLTMADGRRVVLDVAPCGRGWFVAFLDVSAMGILQEAVTHRERHSALGGLSTAVARELNDPMSIVQGRLELLLELVGVVDAETTERHLRVALDHARRISATLRNLRLVGQRSGNRLHKLELHAVVTEALDLLGPRRERVQLDIEPADLTIGGDAPLFARVLANTLRQTIEGTARGTVQFHARRKARAVRVRIHVGRSGRAEPEDWPELSIEATLLRSLGGELQGCRVQGAPTFDLLLPLPPATRGRARPQQHTMLVVGDELFTDDIAELLDKDGFTFVIARSADEALAHPGPVDVVVSDLLLPDHTSGWGLGRRMLRERHELRDRFLVITDGPIRPLPEPMVPVPKPLSRARLLDALGRRVRRG